MKIPTPKQLPSGSWRVQITKDGKRYSFTEDNPAAAIAAALDFRGDKKTPQDLTLGACIDDYIQLRSSVLSPSTLLSYESYRAHRFQPYMQTKLSQIDRRTLQRMVNDEARQVSAKTVKNAWALVSASLSEYGINTAGINLPAIPRRERPYLTGSEILRFCDAVKGKPCEIPALLALCSLRRSEIFALTWEDVDLKNQTIFVRRAIVKGEDGFVTKETTKTETSTRIVPIIIPQLHSALTRCKAKSGRVCPGNPNTLYNQIKRVCASAGLPDISPHSLRHSFASLAYEKGVNELEVMKIGGWRDLGTMKKIYTHLSEKQISAATEKLKSHFEMGKK